MALVTVEDPYEWIDPEVGRCGILVHTSVFDPPRPLLKIVPERLNWTDVWGALDKGKESNNVTD